MEKEAKVGGQEKVEALKEVKVYMHPLGAVSSWLGEKQLCRHSQYLECECRNAELLVFRWNSNLIS
jgi:hypothetical protein